MSLTLEISKLHCLESSYTGEVNNYGWKINYKHSFDCTITAQILKAVLLTSSRKGTDLFYLFLIIS